MRGDVDDPIGAWRAEFPILDRTVYMISNSLGAMPRGAARSLAEYAETWATRGVRAWEARWWEMAGEVGNRVAGIIGAPAGSVSMHDNVTTDIPDALAASRAIKAREVIVDYWPRVGIRVSPHFHNTFEELDQLGACPSNQGTRS